MTITGVIFPMVQPIIGVKETISKLRQCGKRIGFVTNNNYNGLKKLLEKFNQHELDVNSNDIIYPTRAMMDYLKSIDFDKEIYLISFPIVKEEFREAGFKLADLPGEIEENAAGIAGLMKYKPDIGAVILDVDLNISFPKLFEASIHLKRPDVLFIAGGTDKKIPLRPNLMFMGPGYFQEVLVHFTGRKPLMFGKPGMHLNEYVVKQFHITNSSRTLFVGDTLEQDIAFASNSGYQKLLVLSGTATSEQLSTNKNEDYVPDFYVDSFGDLHKLIKDKLGI